MSKEKEITLLLLDYNIGMVRMVDDWNDKIVLPKVELPTWVHSLPHFSNTYKAKNIANYRPILTNWTLILNWVFLEYEYTVETISWKIYNQPIIIWIICNQ